MAGNRTHSERTAASGDGNTADLVRRWRRGDQQAAQAIFDRYVARLSRLARARLSPRLAGRIDADDVVMSAYRSFFVAARAGRFQFEKSGDLWRLLVEMTLHKLYRAATRHQSRKRSVSAETPTGLDARSRAELMAHEPDPQAVVAVADQIEWIMARLAPAGRRVLELRLQGYDVREIAANVGRSTKSVRRWLDKAKRLVRQSLSQDRPQRTGQIPTPNHSPHRAARAPRTGTRSTRRAHPTRATSLDYRDYLLQRMVGAGASGKVYMAVSRQTGDRVAVKYLRKSFSRDAAAIDRFLAEASILRRIQHAGIIRVQGIGTDRAGGYFIVMDFAAGGDLARRIERAPIAVSHAVRWVLEAARAVHHAHRRGVIHCDLKPSNLLLHDDDRVVVTDFGMARVVGAGAREKELLGGTPAFMAPEQISEQWGKVSPRTDVYGLGAVLYALLARRPPVAGRRLTAVLASVVSRKPIAALRCKGVSRDLARVVARCLSKRPEDRYATAAELAQALEAIA